MPRHQKTELKTVDEALFRFTRIGTERARSGRPISHHDLIRTVYGVTLSDDRKLTPGERRRFERDKDQMASRGIEADYHESANAYKFRFAARTLTIPDLSPEERAFLHALPRLVRHDPLLRSMGLDALFIRRLAGACPGTESGVPADNPFTGYEDINSTAGHRVRPSRAMEVMQHAFHRRQRVQVFYHPLGPTEPRTYTMRIYGMGQARGDYHFVGWVEERNDIRDFRLARIKHAHVLYPQKHKEYRMPPPGKFSVHRYLSRPAWLYGTHRPGAGEEKARIRFSKEVAFMVPSRAPRDAGCAFRPDGSCDMTLRYNVLEDIALLRWLLQFKGHLRILGPDTLRGRAREVLGGLLARHEGGGEP